MIRSHRWIYFLYSASRMAILTLCFFSSYSFVWSIHFLRTCPHRSFHDNINSLRSSFGASNPCRKKWSILLGFKLSLHSKFGCFFFFNISMKSSDWKREIHRHKTSEVDENSLKIILNSLYPCRLCCWFFSGTVVVAVFARCQFFCMVAVRWLRSLDLL